MTGRSIRWLAVATLVGCTADPLYADLPFIPKDGNFRHVGWFDGHFDCGDGVVHYETDGARSDLSRVLWGTEFVAFPWGRLHDRVPLGNEHITCPSDGVSFECPTAKGSESTYYEEHDATFYVTQHRGMYGMWVDANTLHVTFWDETWCEQSGNPDVLGCRPHCKGQQSQAWEWVSD